jgi:hypothetical protein
MKETQEVLRSYPSLKCFAFSPLGSYGHSLISLLNRIIKEVRLFKNLREVRDTSIAGQRRIGAH